MNDTRVEWLRRRVTKSLEISNRLFDEMYSDKVYIDRSTFTPILANGKNPCDLGELELKHQLNEMKLSTDGNRDEMESRVCDYLCESSRATCQSMIKQFFDAIQCDIALMFHVFISSQSQSTNPTKTLHLSTDRLPDNPRDNISSTIYVMKIVEGRVKFPDSSGTALQIDHFMASYCEYCVLPGDSLLMLRRMIGNVYMTLLNPSNHQIQSDQEEMKKDKEKESETMNASSHELYANMVPLMDLIAIEISEKVAAQINIRTISYHEPSHAMNIISLGQKVLNLWSSSYHEQRELIFNSGTDHRWEFDRKLLFEQTNYTARICNDLHCVAEVLGQFEKFLGPRLKEVTKDHKEIDELTNKVEQLKKSLENLPFNIFDRRYNASWEQMMKSFWTKVNEIEERCKTLIDTSFQKLRSAEGAFDLLLDFKNIECRKSIQEQMMKKFRDILVQFGREIELVHGIFTQHKEAPPITKDQPTVSGSIQWSRSLYARIKHVVIRFQEAKDLYESDEFQLVKEQYLNAAKQMVYYEEELFKNWCKNVQDTVDNLLKEPILARHYNSNQSVILQQKQYTSRAKAHHRTKRNNESSSTIRVVNRSRLSTHSSHSSSALRNMKGNAHNSSVSSHHPHQGDDAPHHHENHVKITSS
eukprot:863753_1